MQNLLYLFILLAGFPAGYLLAWLCRDEIIERKWFVALSVLCLIVAIILSFTSFVYKFASILTLFFMIIISLMAVWKSHDKRFVK